MSDSQDIPYGYCHCGCGKRTKLAPKTLRAEGWVKGRPLRFIHGHHPRIRDRYRIEDRGYETPCWIWQLALSPAGYGREGGRFAHRNSWRRKNGPIPEGLQLDHLCRNRACVNPDHLEPVTGAENTRRGSNTILTVEKVREIREALARGETQEAIGARYGVHRTTISGIALGTRWRL